MAFLPNLHFVDLRQCGIDAQGRVQNHPLHIALLYKNLAKSSVWHLRYDVTQHIGNIVIISERRSKKRQLGFIIVLPIIGLLACDVQTVVIFDKYLSVKDDVIEELLNYVKQGEKKHIVVSSNGFNGIPTRLWLTDASGEGEGPYFTIQEDVSRQTFFWFITTAAYVLKMDVRLYKSNYGGISMLVDGVHIWSLIFPDIDYDAWTQSSDWRALWKRDQRTLLLKKGQVFKTCMLVETRESASVVKEFRLPENFFKTLACVFASYGMTMNYLLAQRSSFDD